MTDKKITLYVISLLMVFCFPFILSDFWWADENIGLHKFWITNYMIFYGAISALAWGGK